MTDTTNHAQVIRAFIDGAMTDDHDVASCLFCTRRYNAARNALDALTREAESAARSEREWADRFHQARLTLDLERKEFAATIAAQSERIAKLEGFVRHTDLCQAKRMLDPANHGSMTKGCTCGLRAALAPKEKS